MVPLSRCREALESVGLVPGLALAEIHARLEMGLRLQDTGQRVLAYYLTEMENGRLYQATGHASTAHYAETRLGLDRRRTGELIAVGRRLLALPAIDAAFCKQQIGWSKVLHLVTVATPEHEEAWLARAERLSCRDLALEVRLTRPGGPPRAPGDRKGLPEIRFRMEATFGTLTHQKLDLAKEKLSAECARPVNEAELLDTMAELFLNLEEDGTVPGRTRVSSSLYRIVLRPAGDGEGGEEGPLLVDTDLGWVPVDGIDHHGGEESVGSACLLCDAERVRAGDGPAGGRGGVDAKTPAWLRRRVLARDGHRCRSCGSRHRLMAHHIRYRSEHGPTRASNLIALCVRCHGLVHAGLLVLEGEDAARVRFLDARGRPLCDPRAGSDPAASLPLSPPPGDEESRVPAEPGPAPATLDALPEAVDGAWWRRHDHLLRFGPQGIELEEGVPLREEEIAPAGEAASPHVPFAEAFSGIVGQDALLRRLETAARGSEIRGQTFPHTLLTGPAGTGKTTLAQRLAACLGRRLVKATGPLLQNVLLLVRLLAGLREKDVLFVEEVHAASRPVVEALYEAMAERSLSLTLHAGARARTVRFDLPPFTLVAATTEEADLPSPFVSRFGLREFLGYYASADLARLVAEAARAQGFDLHVEASRRMAEFARGTPREAQRLLERVLDDAAGQGLRRVEGPAVEAALARLGYDGEGLDPLERRYMALLRRSAGPIPLTRLSRLLGTNERTLLRDAEPFLFRRGLIDTTPRGRIAVHRPRLREAGPEGEAPDVRRTGTSSPEIAPDVRRTGTSVRGDSGNATGPGRTMRV